MRLGFVTCVQLGLDCLEEMYSSGFEAEVLITLPDSQSRTKSGRVFLDDFARDRGARLVKSENVNDAAVIEAVKDAKVDWLFIIGWSQIAKMPLLRAPNLGALGIHPTLLPEGRGRAAIPWAILKGLDRTGATMFRLDAGVDTGDILDQVTIELTGTSTASDLYAKVCEAHRTLMSRTLPKLASGSAEFTVQDESKASEWPGRSPADGRFHSGMKVEEVDRLVRATTRPYPGAFFERRGLEITVWKGSMKPHPGAEPFECVDGTYWMSSLENRR